MPPTPSPQRAAVSWCMFAIPPIGRPCRPEFASSSATTVRVSDYGSLKESSRTEAEASDAEVPSDLALPAQFSTFSFPSNTPLQQSPRFNSPFNGPRQQKKAPHSGAPKIGAIAIL